MLSLADISLSVCDLNMYEVLNKKSSAALPPHWLAFVHPNQIVCANEHRPAVQTTCQTAVMARCNGNKCH